MKIGFIGLGFMGGAICHNVIRRGDDVYVFDFDTDKVKQMENYAPNAHGVTTKDALADVDVIFTSLPLPKHVLETMTGEKGLFHQMKAGSVHIDVSTIDPNTAETLETEGKRYGIGFLGCPEGKGPAQAEKAEQPIFAGGDMHVFTRMKPLLEGISNQVYYLGGVRQAYAFKLISNMIGMTNLAILAEGIHVAEAAGLDGKLFQKLLADTGADSAQLHMRGEAIRTRDFHNKFGVDLALKDLRLGTEMTADLSYQAYFTKLAQNFYQKASENGDGKKDCAAVFEVL